MPNFPRALLVSEDAELERLHMTRVHIDPVSKIARLKADLRLPADKKGQLGSLLRDPSPEILRHLESTTRSFNARVGFDFVNVQLGDALPDRNGDLLFQSDVVLYPGEHRDGTPMQSPLLEILPRMLANKLRLKVLRLFFRAGVQPFDGARIQQERDQQRLKLHEDAVIVDDGVVLPPGEWQFPLRFDLMEDAMLIEGLAGFGRGVIDELQPAVRDRSTVLPGLGYRITSTRFSLGAGRRGVLYDKLVDLRTKKEDPTKFHGNSKLWDGWRTAGMRNVRHLEWGQTGCDAAPLFDETGKPPLGSKVQIYPAPTEGTNGVSVTVPKKEFHESGVTVTHWLGTNGKHDAIQRVRATLRALDEGEDWGVLAGPEGLRPISPEQHPQHQTREVRKQVMLYGRNGGTAYPKYPVAELGEFLRHVGNPQQRTALFCRELPPPHTVQMLVSMGVRIVFTGNVSGKANRIYFTNNQLQHYKRLMREGDLQLYLVTPTRIRQLWNDLFVDVRKLEQIQKTDVRIGCYGASADNAEIVLDRGLFREALKDWAAKYPDTALITGGAKNGAMGYMNRIATDLGILTVGVANEVQGQEVPDEELDAVMTFDRDGFEARQAVMAQQTTHPLAGPGAQGTDYEIRLENVLRKTGKTCFTPLPLVDPIGLGPEGAHLWASAHEIQSSFNEEHPVGDGRTFRLTRSPYVAAMSRPVKTYKDALQWHDEFMQDPERHWKEWGVPEDMLRVSIERTLRDSEETGFPFPSFYHAAAKRLGLI